MSASVSERDLHGLSDLDFEWSAPHSDWMSALAAHYDRVRIQRPDGRLLILFDIDGTILDMRHMVRWALLSYDRVHGTEHFHGLPMEAVTVHENQVDRLLREWPVPDGERDRVMRYYREYAWTDEAILASHQPYRGVLDVIRWFQIQPRTDVALNTGRPESFRDVTLRSLNALGQEYRVRFHSELLFMAPRPGNDLVPKFKAEGLRHFQRLGYHVFAVVDNEPENIDAMARADLDGDILFLHADTIFESKPSKTPRTVRGKFYDVTNLVSERRLPRHVQFVWHGVNNRAALQRFFSSEIQWGEVDVRRDPLDRLVVRHASFDDTPWSKAENQLPLEDCFREFQRHNRSVKLDLKNGGAMIRQVDELIRAIGLPDVRLWFNGNVQALGEDGFRSLAESHPGSIIQAPVDFLTPLILAMPDKACDILESFASWGVTRFSLSWRERGIRQAIEQLEEWGYEVNIYGVPNLEAFLQAALLLPRSLTSDFNFPKWSR